MGRWLATQSVAEPGWSSFSEVEHSNSPHLDRLCVILQRGSCAAETVSSDQRRRLHVCEVRWPQCGCTRPQC